MAEHNDSRCISHEPCPACGSKDNLGRYDDGHAYCFGCEYYEHSDPGTDRSGSEGRDGRDYRGNAGDRGEELQALLDGSSVSAIPKRRLDLEACRKYDYRAG